MPTKLFTKDDPRRWTKGKQIGLPSRVRKLLGEDLSLVAEVFARAALTGKLSFDSVRNKKVRRIDTSDLPDDRTLTPEQYLSFLTAAGIVVRTREAKPDEETAAPSVVVYLPKVANE